MCQCAGDVATLPCNQGTAGAVANEEYQWCSDNAAINCNSDFSGCDGWQPTINTPALQVRKGIELGDGVHSLFFF